MFKYIKQMRELKQLKLQYQVVLLGKVYEFIETLDNGSEILSLADKLKDVKDEDLVSEFVKGIKETQTPKEK